MQSHSALARLQQLTTLSVWACAVAWLAWHWRDSPAVAAAGFVAIAFFYSLVLAIEFVAMRFVSRSDPSLRPGWGELVLAWLGETAMAFRVFCWRQPFRWDEVPDRLQTAAPPPPKRGAVFIHGFVCNRGFWTPWLKALAARDHCFVAVNLEPVFGSIDSYVPAIEQAVRQVTQATGLAPVLVCHSMGGLAARAWLHAMSGGDRVHRVVTIGSPHHGTWLGHFSHLTNGRQMRWQGDWVRELAGRGGPEGNARFTCWYSNCDNIVFPVATATLEGADNRLVRGAAHVALGFHPRVMSETMAYMTGSAQSG